MNDGNDNTSLNKSETTLAGSRNIFTGNLSVLGASNIVSGLGSGLIGAYVPLYFVELGGSPVILGAMTAASSIIGVFMFLLGGFVADYYGRRPIIVISSFYAVFFPLLYAITQDWGVFAVLSVGAALGSVSAPALRALVVDSVPSERRTIGIATLKVAVSIPAAFAPLVSGWLIQSYGLLDGFRFSCVYAGAAVLLSSLILLFFLKETLRRRPDQETESSYFAKLKNMFKISVPLSESLKALVFSYTLVAFANGAVGPFYILYASTVIGLSPLQWAPIAAIQSLSVVMTIPGGWLSDKFGKRTVMVLSLLACAPCPILFSLSESFYHTLIVAVLLVITGIYYAPAYEALQADMTPGEARGRIIAVGQLSAAVFSALGTLTGGFLFEVSPVMPFYLFTVAVLSSAVLLVVLVRESKRNEIPSL